MNQPVARTRIQRKNIKLISDAALSVFSANGFRGATVDQIAREANLSKPNLLYYFPTKEAIHRHLLSTLMDTWLDPLRDVDPAGEPLDEILTYLQRKLQMSRDHPRESRLFANEILQGAPHILDLLASDLKDLVDDKAALITTWMNSGRIARADPYHLIFSIWSLTQHYADYDVQIHAILGPKKPDPFPEAETYLTEMFTRMLTPP
ncbi:TetR family transcriptional regulator C-terminal domain-containing protein [Pseudooceanicola algae]|uniref:HTH-type transcriptional regulator RutR n=1 Tax=Pseudooceanicola algae TaxID=1537215 RepID=A0A418SJA3_9RHOB|nr:TetR family transcriptional regulator C-terminal domain-containing protein [Pseudooceanicola algae]QPM90180.1 HTH-type transcriptional regulator RutR [Pseudooceanicola algae]